MYKIFIKFVARIRGINYYNVVGSDILDTFIKTSKKLDELNSVFFQERTKREKTIEAARQELFALEEMQVRNARVNAKIKELIS